MKTIKSHTFNGRKVWMDLGGECDGLVDCPHGTDPTSTMRIFKPLNTRGGMEALFHESLHLLRWAETEDVIEKTAYELAKIAWRVYGDDIRGGS